MYAFLWGCGNCAAAADWDDVSIIHLVCRDDEEVAGPDEDFSHLEQRIADAQERQETATKQFNRLCSICIAAQQACATLLQ